MKIILKILVITFVSFVVCGCSEPVKKFAFYDFDTLSGWRINDTARLELNLKDSSLLKKIFISFHLCNSEDLNLKSQIPIVVKICSADSINFIDSLRVPIDYNSSATGSILEFEKIYLQNIAIKNDQIIKIEAIPISSEYSSIFKHIYGIGFRYE